MKWDLSSENDEYFSGTSRFRYYIKSRDEDSRPPFRLQVFVVGEESDPMVLEVTSTAEDGELVSTFQSLYDAAKRAYIGLKNSLPDEVLRDLNELF